MYTHHSYQCQSCRTLDSHLLAAHVLPGEGVGGGGGGPQAGEDQQRDDHGAGHGSQLHYHGADLSGLQPIQSMLTLPPLRPAVVSHLAAASLLIYLKLKYCETGLCFDSIHDIM